MQIAGEAEGKYDQTNQRSSLMLLLLPSLGAPKRAHYAYAMCDLEINIDLLAIYCGAFDKVVGNPESRNNDVVGAAWLHQSCVSCDASRPEAMGATDRDGVVALRCPWPN